MRSKANLNVVSLKNGEDGATFTPSINSDGYLIWSNDKGLQNPPPFKLNGSSTSPVDETIYNITTTDYILTGKVVVQREGSIVILNGVVDLKQKLVKGTVIFTLDLKYRPVSNKTIGFINTSGFCYITVNTDGTVTFEGGDSGTANESYEIDGRYNIL